MMIILNLITYVKKLQKPVIKLSSKYRFHIERKIKIKIHGSVFPHQPAQPGSPGPAPIIGQFGSQGIPYTAPDSALRKVLIIPHRSFLSNNEMMSVAKLDPTTTHGIHIWINLPSDNIKLVALQTDANGASYHAVVVPLTKTIQ
jgi:hypothetical protein